MSHVNLAQAEGLALGRLRQKYGPAAESLSMQAYELAGIGWIFTYDSKAFLQGGDADEALVGNAPVIVDYRGNTHQPMSGEPVQEYVDKLREKLQEG